MINARAITGVTKVIKLKLKHCDSHTVRVVICAVFCKRFFELHLVLCDR